MLPQMSHGEGLSFTFRASFIWMGFLHPTGSNNYIGSATTGKVNYLKAKVARFCGNANEI
jgi:hypothetical protein